MTKPTKWHVCPVKTQISLGICPVWSESLLSEWRKLGSLATHWAHSKDPDQTGRMPRLIRVFTGRTVILLSFVIRWLNYAVSRSKFITPECIDMVQFRLQQMPSSFLYMYMYMTFLSFYYFAVKLCFAYEPKKFLIYRNWFIIWNVFFFSHSKVPVFYGHRVIRPKKLYVCFRFPDPT